MENIFMILSFLPTDIINRIIPYTYQPQGKSLIRDIESFYTTRLAAQKLYHYQYVVLFGEAEPNDRDWLINDLLGLSNQYIPTMYGYVDYFYHFFLRNRFVKTREDVFKYIQKMEMKEVNTQINIFWGLLSKEERNIFLKNINPLVNFY